MAKKAVNVSTRPRGHNDNPQKMIRRFMRKVKKERILEQFRNNRFYEKPSTKRRKAAKRRRRVLDKLREKERNS